MSEDELIEELKSLTDRYEQSIDGRTFDTLSDYTLKQINGVIGIQIEVTDWTLKYELSQNRDDEDYVRIIEELYKTNKLMDTMLADEMRKLRGV